MRDRTFEKAAATLEIRHRQGRRLVLVGVLPLDSKLRRSLKQTGLSMSEVGLLCHFDYLRSEQVGPHGRASAPWQQRPRVSEGSSGGGTVCFKARRFSVMTTDQLVVPSSDFVVPVSPRLKPVKTVSTNGGITNDAAERPQCALWQNQVFVSKKKPENNVLYAKGWRERRTRDEQTVDRAASRCTRQRVSSNPRSDDRLAVICCLSPPPPSLQDARQGEDGDTCQCSLRISAPRGNEEARLHTCVTWFDASFFIVQDHVTRDITQSKCLLRSFSQSTGNDY